MSEDDAGARFLGKRFLAILASDNSQYALYGTCARIEGDLVLEMERGGRLPLDEAVTGRVHAVTEADRSSEELAGFLGGVDYVVPYSVGMLAEGEGADFIDTGVNIAELDQAQVTLADAD